MNAIRTLAAAAVTGPLTYEAPHNLASTPCDTVSDRLDDRRDTTVKDGANRRARRLTGHLAIALALIAACLTFSEPPRASAAQQDDWQITSAAPSGTRVMPGPLQYRLYNRTAGRKLRYGRRPYQPVINLKWGLREGARNIRFERLAGSGPLRYGESVAIHVDHGDYLRYKNRLFGINLSWSSTPVYHWRIKGGHGVIRTGQSLSIYNKAAADLLVYGKQNYGINLDWYKDLQNADNNTPTTANANLGVRTGPYTSGGRCSGRVVWQLRPISLTGTTGIDHAVTVDRSFDEPAVSGGGHDGMLRYFCQFDALTGNLRTGTWKVEASTPVWSTSCEVTLRAQPNAIHFSQNRAGCTENPFTWPGDGA